MPDLTIPPDQLPWDRWLDKVRHLATHDLPTARRVILLRLIWQQAHRTQQNLIHLVETLLQQPCFGPTTFQRDIAQVRQVLAEAGYQLRYSRQPQHLGYYIEGRPVLDEKIRRMIAGAVAEVDSAQMEISRHLTPAQQVQQGLSMVRLAEQVSTYRQQYYALAEQPEGHHLIRERGSSDMADLTMDYPEMDFGEFMRSVLDALNAAEVEYMIGGAIALWAWGEARTTRDFDVVINIPFENIPKLSQELEKRDMLVPYEIILDLLVKREGDIPVNAIQLNTGYKAELFLLRPNDAQRATALSRRRLVDLGPPLGQVYVHAPEDLILYKLHYFNISHQSKHFRDITAILEKLGGTLDLDYIEQWATQLGLMDVWQDILGQALGDEEFLF